MRYKELMESVELDTLRNLPFYKDFKNLTLYRGTENPPPETVFQKFRFRNKSVDTPFGIHQSINEEAEKKFGLPIRNLLFAYSHDIDTRSYGSPTIILPVGEFRLFAHKNTFDMTIENDLDLPHYNFYFEMFKKVVENLSDGEFPLSDFEKEKLVERYNQNINKHGNDIDVMFTWYIWERMSQHDMEDSDDVFQRLRNVVTEQIAKSYQEFAQDYISDVYEISPSDTVGDVEIMIYAPEGFYTVPEGSLEFQILRK